MMRLKSMKFVVVGLLALFSPLLFAANLVLAELPPLPVPISEGAWRPLSAHEDASLEDRLAQALKRNSLWQALISEEKMAVGVVDLTDPVAPRFAQINGGIMMYAGSLAKLAILFSAYCGFDDGTLVETPEIYRDMIEMMRRSDNAATNRMIDRIGLRRIEAVVVDPNCRFYDVDQGGGIWLGRRFANSGEVDREPLKGLIHGATVTQVCRFYYLLATGMLISEERSRQMLHILSFPDIHDKFISVLERSIPLAHLYRKSGTWPVWYSDSVLVWDETGGKYILVGMVENERGEEILRELVPVIQHLLNVKESL
jgi:beta-lactamase class A